MKERIRSIRWPVTIIFVLVWFMAFTLLTGMWPLVRSSGDYGTISNIEYGFAVDYPLKWSAQVYGEHGYKGADYIKLRISQSAFDQFVIHVNYQPAIEPTLQDVIAWGNELTGRFRRTSESIAQYEEFGLQQDTLREQPIARLRYRSRDRMYEDVYIPRDNDMIILTIQAPKDEFDNYLEEFESIVASFRPIE